MQLKVVDNYLYALFEPKKKKYSQTSNISRTKSQKLNVFRLVLQLPFPNPLRPAVKSRMKM